MPDSENCPHNVTLLERLDSSGWGINDAGRVEMWAECSCGAPVIVEMQITDIQVDTEESVAYDDPREGDDE